MKLNNKIMYLDSLWFIIAFLVYTLGLYIFGGYIRLIELLDIFNCFMHKELNDLDKVYDYIVVGCGSAGSVAALRLAANKNMTVLVLEAGAHGGMFFDIPAIGPILHLSTFDWQYHTVAQKHASKAFSQQASKWPMGRIVGGTGRLNNMLYLRGHSTDYYNWFKDYEDFDYERDILEYFKKSEDHRGAYKNNTGYHSSDGPLIVEDLSFVSDLGTAMLEAANILKYSVGDLNGESNTGFMQSQVNMNFGDRWTPASYLLQQNKPNLVLQTNTLVTKVLLKSNFEAYAVKYIHLGKTSNVLARRGIILCAGVIGTPKLLMLSGIGPQDHLNEIGIKTEVNLPVGNNLQDHVTTGLDLVTLNTSLGVDLKSVMTPITILKYLLGYYGPWTTAGCEVMGLIDTESESSCSDHFNSLTENKLKVKEQESSHAHDIATEICTFNKTRPPDLQLMVLPMGISTDGGSHFQKAIGITRDVWKNYFAPLVGMTAVSILPVVLHPKSHGTVRLIDSNIYSQPLINPNYLSDQYDVEILLKGISLIKKFINTEPLQRLGAKLNEQKFPGCEHLVFDTPTYWECYVRHFTVTAFHPVGTCKMGSATDPSAVVGYNFQVHGTHKLFVADASVMPTLPSGNVNAGVVMIGEKAATEIQNELFLNRGACHCQELFVQRKQCRI